MSLPSASVQRPVTVAMACAAFVTIGLVSLLRLPVEMMPNISTGDMSIIIQVRGGMPPAEVENLVTKPVEEAVSTVSGLRNVISSSKKGESWVMLEFEPGTHMDFAALEVREKFATVKDKLPREIEKPVIAQYKQSDQPLILVAMTSDAYTPEQLRRIADEDLKERILRVEGIANVDVYGGQERKILVEIDQDRLRAYRLSIHQVISALGVSNMNLLAGGLPEDRREYLVRTIGEFRSLKDIEQTGLMVTPSGSLIRVGDVATVRDSFLEPESLARVNVKPVVSLYIFKESTTNTVRAAKGVEAELDKARARLDSAIHLKVIMNQADAINDAIASVYRSLWDGALLAGVVLFLFLLSWRSTLIIALSMPLSVMATFCLMYILRLSVYPELSINIMTLSGLAMGTGMIIDSSIVVLENIFAKRGRLRSPRAAACEGAEEVFLALLASTVTTVIVFLPFVFVNEETKRLWFGLAVVVLISQCVSLLVSVTLVPMLAARLLGRPRRAVRPPARLFVKCRRAYRHTLTLAVRYRYLFVLMTLSMFALAVYWSSARLEREFLMSAEEGRFTIFVELEPGAKLGVSDLMVAEVEQVLHQMPEVKNFSSRIEPSSSKIYVKLVPLAGRARSAAAIIEQLRADLKPIEERYKGGFIYFSEIQEKGIKEITLDLFGYDYAVLKELATSMANRLATIEGFQDIRMSRIEGRPEWGVRVDKPIASDVGLSVADVAETLHAQTRGLRATLYHTETKEVEVVVRLQKRFRRTLDDLRQLTLVSAEGEPLQVEQMSQFVPSVVPGEIIRKNKSRLIHVTATSTRLSSEKAVERIQDVMQDIQFPKDYYYRIGGDYYRNLENQRQLVLVFSITVVLVFMVLASLFESYAQPFLIMVAVPLAAVGVVSALAVSDKPISRGVLVGVIMLAGIVVNNSIVLVDHINDLRRRGYKLVRAVVSGGEDRLRPILMTALTTIFGLIPMAFDQSESASLWSPLAVTMIGGLLSSTFLVLFVIPGLYGIQSDIKRYTKVIQEFLSKTVSLPYRKYVSTY